MIKRILLTLLLAMPLILIGCEPDDEPSTSSTTSSSKSKSKTISKPTVNVTSHFASGTYDGWYVIGTVTTGDDDPSNVDCCLEWAKFAKKQTGSVNLTNSSKMKVVNSSRSRVQFKKEFAGINKGNYIYYRMVGSNSKYSSSTSTTYMVAQ